MAKYITLKVEDETFDQLRLHTKHREVWLGSPTGDWSPKRAFLDSLDLAQESDLTKGNIGFVEDEYFDSVRQATDKLIASAFQAGTDAINAEAEIIDFKPTSSIGLKDTEL